MEVLQRKGTYTKKETEDDCHVLLLNSQDGKGAAVFLKAEKKMGHLKVEY